MCRVEVRFTVSYLEVIQTVRLSFPLSVNISRHSYHTHLALDEFQKC